MPYTNVTANSSSYNAVEQGGDAWLYNDGQYTYNGVGTTELLYNAFGQTQSYSNATQSSASSYTNVTVN